RLSVGTYTFTITAKKTQSDNSVIQGTACGQFMIIGVPDGAPTLDLSITPSTNVYTWSTVTVVATVTYPNSATYPNDSVNLVITKPDRTVQSVAMSRISSETFRYSCGVPQAGQYQFTATVYPPNTTKFVPTTRSIYQQVYAGTLSVTVLQPTAGSKYNLWDNVPLKVQVKSGSNIVTDALVSAEILYSDHSNSGDMVASGFLYSITQSDYETSFTAMNSGSCTIRFTATQANTKSGQATVSITIQSVTGNLKSAFKNCVDAAIQNLSDIQQWNITFAQEGDYFRKEKAADETKRGVDLYFSLVDAFTGINQVRLGDWYHIHIPGGAFWINKAGAKSLASIYGESVQTYFENNATNLAANLPHLTYTEVAKYFAKQMVFKTAKAITKDEAKLILSNKAAELGTQPYYEPYFASLVSSKEVELSGSIYNEWYYINRNFPSFPQSEQVGYLRDLTLRKGANQAYADYYKNKGSLLHYTYGEQTDPRTLADILNEVLSVGAKTGAKILAGAFLDGPGIIASSAIIGYIDWQENSAEIALDEQMIWTAQGLMPLAFEQLKLVSGNTFSGMYHIKDHIPVQIPAGTIEYGVDWFYHNSNINIPDQHVSINVLEGAFTSFVIRNTGATPATYKVVASFNVGNNLTFTTDVLYGSTDAGHSEGVLIQPGNQAYVTIQYIDGWHNLLRKCADIKIDPLYYPIPVKLQLFATNTHGTFLVDEKWHNFEPINQTGALRLGMKSAHGITLDTTTSIYAVINPISTKLGYPEKSINYRIRIHAWNPFSWPIAATISEELPSNVSVAKLREGSYANGTVSWLYSLQPNETKIIEYEITTDAEPGTVLSIPGATLSIDNFSSATTWIFSSDSVQCLVRHPLWVDVSLPGTSIQSTMLTIPITVSNLAYTTASGNFIFSLANPLGEIISNNTEQIVLSSQANTTFNLHYQMDFETGTYYYQVTLNYGTTNQTVFFDSFILEPPPPITNIPDIKLLKGKSVSNILDLDNYYSNSSANWQCSVKGGHLGVSIDTEHRVSFSVSTPSSFVGQDTVIFSPLVISQEESNVKYSSYLLRRLPEVLVDNGLRINNNDINLQNYISKDTNIGYPSNYPYAIRYENSLDTGKLIVTFSGNTIRISPTKTLSGSAEIIVTATPDSSSNDWDKEIIRVYEVLNSYGQFTVSSDTSRWYFEKYGDGTGTGTLSRITAYAGQSGVLKLTQTPGQKAKLSQIVTVPAPGWYTARAKVATDIADTTKQQKVYLYLYELSEDTAIIACANQVIASGAGGFGGSGVWKNLMVSFYTQSTIVSVQVVGINPTNSSITGSLYIDNIWVYRAPPQVERCYGATNVAIANASFDTSTSNWLLQVYGDGTGTGTWTWINNLFGREGLICGTQAGGEKAKLSQLFRFPTADKNATASVWVYSGATSQRETQKVYLYLYSFDSGYNKIKESGNAILYAGQWTPGEWRQIRFGYTPMHSYNAIQVVSINPSGNPRVNIYFDDIEVNQDQDSNYYWDHTLY
ncbi:MAG: hypothetical protein N3A72_12360, partial [bacterium]|nr:hypothetical protein [bacterium]